MSLLKAFNGHLKEFCDDLILIFPQDISLKATKFFMFALMKTKPKEIVHIWKEHVIGPYSEQIKRGDFTFFQEKNYAFDVGERADGSHVEILESIVKIQQKVLIMSPENKTKSMKYVQNLTKLCNLYFMDNS